MVLKIAKKIIIEVNSSVPKCWGGNGESIHISKVDYIVEGNSPPLIELPEVSISEVDKKLGARVMKEIPDGACLQLGIGAIPNVIGAMIAQLDLKDLGVHTEMLADSCFPVF